jgi:tetratricopeptide (TPR) repeat protein
MVMAPVHSFRGLIAAVLVSLCTLAGGVQAADTDAAPRQKALALNNVTGDKPILGEVKNLLQHQESTRQLLRVAVSMAKQKDQPFNYNGAYILARTALQLREPETSKVFFRICLEQASKLQSSQKMVEAYSGMLAVIDMLITDKKYDDSLKLSQEFLEILDRQGVSTEAKSSVLRQMCRALAKQGKVKEANRLIDDLLKAREGDWRNLELKAWLQNETGHPGEAIKTYEKVVDRIAKDDNLDKSEKTDLEVQVRESMFELLVQLGKVDEASRVMDDILGETKEDLSKLELKGRLQQRLGRNAAALKSYEELLEHLAKNDSLKEEQKAAVQEQVRLRMLQVLVKLGKVDEAKQVMEEVLKGQKDELDRLKLKGLLEQRIGDYKAALQTYQEMLQRIAKDSSLKEVDKTKQQQDVRYVLSNVYVELGQLNKATELLQALLAENPNDPSYNNDLGYLWADHDQNLDEAEKLIRKALEEDRKKREAHPTSPDDDKAAYLDSLGWVLFKQKKYQEAKKYLLEATHDEEGKNIEIYDHLGDVYMALGEKAKALDIWKKAVKLETTGRREEQKKAAVEKKIKANQ